MSTGNRKDQTAEEMQAAARRIIARQDERQRKKRGRPPRKAEQAVWPPDPAKMPKWWTPEKQAYSDQVMKAREEEAIAAQQQERTRAEQARLREQQREQKRLAQQQERQRLLHLLASASAIPMNEADIRQAEHHHLAVEFIQGLFVASRNRRLVEHEYVWFVENVGRLSAPLPFIPGHFLNSEELIFQRLPEDGQWQVILQHIDRDGVFVKRLGELLDEKVDQYFPKLAGAMEATPEKVQHLPWRLQYRLAMTWLAESSPHLWIPKWHPFVAALLKAANTRHAGEMKRVLDSLMASIAKDAYHSTDRLNYTPFIAPCRLNISCVHCQGQPWQSKPGLAYCAELGMGCDLAPKGKAWIAPDLTVPPYQWSLLELLNFVGITPMQMYASEGLRSDGDFQKMLGGWINRLNKIRKLLACRTCGIVMQPNKGYAKFLAAYPVTIFKCDHHPLPEVKITHCWLCEDVIDSRDSRFQDAGTTYNLCISCGAGERGRATIGRSCPKCGTGPMRLRRASKYSSAKNLVCPSCSKSIGVNKKVEQYLAPEVT